MLNHSESAESAELKKNLAINSVQKWIILSWVLAFLVIIVLPWVLERALSNADDIQKAATTLLVGVLMNVIYWVVASSRIKDSVMTAIEASARAKADLDIKKNEEEYRAKLQEYKRDHPSIQEVEEKIWRDFRCLIPRAVRHEELIEVSDRACREQKIRDNIYAKLAFEEDLLSGMVYSFIKCRFEHEFDGEDELPDIFLQLHTDLFAFLRAWLMLSIRHSIFMPVDYIVLRFRAPNNPDIETYKAAFLYLKEVFRYEEGD
ncbi:MAG: hypothetical protein AAF722_04635 [Cyanobacteria bacterium P01_C01_bin.70]